MKPSESRAAERENRERLSGVVAKLIGRDRSEWGGYLETSEFLLLLKHGASALPSLEAAARTAHRDARPRWYWLTPGPLIRAMASEIPIQSQTKPKPKP